MNNHYITLHYAPTEEAKKVYAQIQADPSQRVMLMNWGNLKNSDDPWIQQNVIFEDSKPDNISKLNPHWCEMTTIYWAWKNGDIKDDDWVQHSHYRKFLQIPEEHDSDIDIIIAQSYPMVFNVNGVVRRANIEQGSKLCHPLPSWCVMQDVLTKGNGWTGDILWDEWRRSQEMFAPLNVWKMKGKLFKEYCEWAFPRAFEIDDRLREYISRDSWAKEYDTLYQRRWLSFIGERMFSWWCFCKNMGGVKVGAATVKVYDNFKPFTDEEERGMKNDTELR